MPAAHLGIDFGTSHTVAVLRRADGRVETLMFGGTSLLPSAVFAEADGTIRVGADAVHSARTAPASFEPHPKRRIDHGTVLLGEREFAVEDLFAAVLRKVRTRCAEVARSVPEAVTLTHPASWGPRRTRVLKAAAEKAGLPRARLLSEPVAAAVYYTRELGHEVPVGAAVVVHDFGGGTFDAAVVRRTGLGFEVLAVDGLDDLGGVDVDEALLQNLRTLHTDSPAWTRLLAPSTSADRRDARIFREDVRSAKELLSGRTTADLHIPLLDRDVHVTRAELEAITAPLLARAVKVTSAVIEESGTGAGRLAGVFLVGGGSRMPLVATLLHRELGRAPLLADHIEQVVAHGATLDEGPPATTSPPPQRLLPAPPPVSPPLPPPTSSTTAKRPLALWVLSAVLGLELLGSFIPSTGVTDERLGPIVFAAVVVLLLAAQGISWVRVPLARSSLVVGQVLYTALHAGLMFERSGDWRTAAVQLPWIALGIAGLELAAAKASAEWYRVPVGPRLHRRARVRRAGTAVAVPALLIALVMAAPWSADTASGEGTALTEIARFTPSSDYREVAGVSFNGRQFAVGAREDGYLDVFDPRTGALFDAHQTYAADVSDLEVAFVNAEAVAIVSGPGFAFVIDLDSGGEECRLDPGGREFFAEIAVGARADRTPVLVSAAEGVFGVWDLRDCTPLDLFTAPAVPADPARDAVIVLAGGGPAAFFAHPEGPSGPFGLDDGTAVGVGAPFTGSHDMAATREGDLVSASAERLSHWDLGTAGEIAGVDLGETSAHRTVAAARFGERLVGAVVGADGVVRVCDLTAAEETASFDLGTGSGSAPPLLGFAGGVADPVLVVVASGEVRLLDLPF